MGLRFERRGRMREEEIKADYFFEKFLGDGGRVGGGSRE